MSITAMKQALEVMGLMGADLICEAAHHKKKDLHEIGEPCPIQQRWHKAFDALRTAIEQAEKQEPVAWLYLDAWGTLKLSQIIPPPVGAFPVYTTPLAAPREWVGLTDEEFDLLVPYCGNEFDLKDYKDFARAIEAKLKEKNT